MTHKSTVNVPPTGRIAALVCPYPPLRLAPNLPVALYVGLVRVSGFATFYAPASVMLGPADTVTV